MALYVIRPDNPPAGTDWIDVVPGQYLYDITGITATLDTGGPTPTVAVDSSGNDRNGTYHAIGGAQIVTGILPAGSPGALDCSGGTGGVSARARVALPVDAPDWTQPWTIEWWWETPQNVGAVFVSNAPGGIEGISIGISNEGGGNYSMFAIVDSIGDKWVSDFFPIDPNVPHYGVVTYNTADIAMYVDGVALTFTTPGPPVEGFVAESNTIASFNGTNDSCVAILEEFAIYDTLLPAIVVADHYAAGSSSFADYTAAVLGDAPFSYYHLDDTGGGPRQVGLAITDGTNLVELIPTGFFPASSSGPYAYSWQPKLNSSSQTPDGSNTTVAISQLILPAGYTIASDTLDLAPSDQWSDVAIWWNSDYMDGLNPPSPYEYPPGAMLVYKQEPDGEGNG